MKQLTTTEMERVDGGIGFGAVVAVFAAAWGLINTTSRLASAVQAGRLGAVGATTGAASLVGTNGAEGDPAGNLRRQSCSAPFAD